MEFVHLYFFYKFFILGRNYFVEVVILRPKFQRIIDDTFTRPIQIS